MCKKTTKKKTNSSSFGVSCGFFSVATTKMKTSESDLRTGSQKRHIFTPMKTSLHQNLYFMLNVPQKLVYPRPWGQIQVQEITTFDSHHCIMSLLWHKTSQCGANVMAKLLLFFQESLLSARKWIPKTQRPHARPLMVILFCLSRNNNPPQTILWLNMST